MFGIDGTMVLGLVVALCGLVPAGMAFVEQPDLLRRNPARPGDRLVGFLSGR